MGLTQGGLAEEATRLRVLQTIEPMSPSCDMLVASIVSPSETTSMMYDVEDIVSNLRNGISRDHILQGFVGVQGSDNPCMVELVHKLRQVDLVGTIVDEDKCKDAVRASIIESRKLSIMLTATVDRDLSWWSFLVPILLPVLKKVAIKGIKWVADKLLGIIGP